MQPPEVRRRESTNRLLLHRHTTVELRGCLQVTPIHRCRIPRKRVRVSPCHVPALFAFLRPTLAALAAAFCRAHRSSGGAFASAAGGATASTAGPVSALIFLLFVASKVVVVLIVVYCFPSLILHSSPPRGRCGVLRGSGCAVFRHGKPKNGGTAAEFSFSCVTWT